MARNDESLLIILAEKPWWWSVVFAAGWFLSFGYIFPLLLSLDPKLNVIAPIPKFFSLLAFIFLIPTPIAIYNDYRKKRMLDSQIGIDSIRALSWKEFEELLGEAYQRQGFIVQENRSAGADGGIDLTLKRDGRRYLVQCKNWKHVKVGVKVIREMYGLAVAEKAAGAVIVTSGTFTEEASRFAAGKPVELIDGKMLVELIREVQVAPRDQAGVRVAVSIQAEKPNGSKSNICPSCGLELVPRIARRGENAGRQFLGCSGFPKCRHTEEYAPES